MSSGVETSPPSGAPGTIILICGLPGAGKTTLAMRLERGRPAVRLTEDEWVARMFPTEAAHDDAVRDGIHDVQWDLAARIAQLGIDVVLDWGLWLRQERDDYRGRAAALGIPTELVFLEVPRDELWRRIDTRNAALPPATFRVEREDLDAWWAMFEPPTAEELGAGAIAPVLPAAE